MKVKKKELNMQKCKGEENQSPGGGRRQQRTVTHLRLDVTVGNGDGAGGSVKEVLVGGNLPGLHRAP